MKRFAILLLVIAAAVHSEAQITGGGTTVQSLGSVTATKFAQGLGWNVTGTKAEIDAAKAAGATWVRLNCASWSSVEGQSAPPNNTSTGYSLSTACQNQITWAAEDGLNVKFVGVYGSPFHTNLDLTASSAIVPGQTVIPVTLVTSYGGSTFTTGSYPYIYLLGLGSAGPRSYAGGAITNITVTSSTTANITLSSATTNNLAAGASLHLTQALYPFAQASLPSDAFVSAYSNYMVATNGLVLGILNGINPSLTSTGEAWNEPPWGADASDNGTDLFDQAALTVTQAGSVLTVVTANSNTVGGNPSTYGVRVGQCMVGTGFPTHTLNGYVDCVSSFGGGTGGTGTYNMTQSVTVSSTTAVNTIPGFGGTGTLTPKAANYGIAAKLQSLTCAANAKYAWAGTEKAGNNDLLQASMQNVTGVPYTQPNNGCLTVEDLHPYGNWPEDSAFNLAAIAANPTGGGANNVFTQSTSNYWIVPQNTYNARVTGGSTYGINFELSETGQEQTFNPSNTSIARFVARQLFTYLTGGAQNITFYKLADLESANVGLTSGTAASGGTATYPGNFTGTINGVTYTGASNGLAGQYGTIASSAYSTNNGQYLITASTATSVTVANPAAVADSNTASPHLQMAVTPVGGWSYINLLDPVGGQPCQNPVQCLAATTFTPNQNYTALAGIMADVASIANAPPAAVVLPTVGSFSGTYQLLQTTIVGARAGSSKNSYITVVWQGSATSTGNGTFASTATSGSNTLTGISAGDIANLTAAGTGAPLSDYNTSGVGVTSGSTITTIGANSITMSAPATQSGTGIYNYNAWPSLLSPALGSAQITIPTGLVVASAEDSVTRAAVAFTVSGGLVTVPVGDDPVEVLMTDSAPSMVGSFNFNGSFTP